MKRSVLAFVCAALAAGSAVAAPRYIGPWYTDGVMSKTTGATSFSAGQNTDQLGITFSCTDQTLVMGVWKPRGSLDLEIARKVGVVVKVDVYDPIRLVGVGMQRNMAEFDHGIGLVMREMLVGKQAEVIFADRHGNTVREVFLLANTGIAFDALARNCRLD